MKTVVGIYIILTFFTSFASIDDRSVLWYNESATSVMDSFPIGTGRVGGLVLGGTAQEQITISEDTLWSGKPHDYANEGTHHHLEELRNLILAEKYGLECIGHGVYGYSLEIEQGIRFSSEGTLRT